MTAGLKIADSVPAIPASVASAVEEINQFLPCATPDRWIENALENQSLMLIDHANCEKGGRQAKPVNRYTDNFVC